MTRVPTIRARIEELIVVSRGLLIELEAARKQLSFIGEMQSDMLKAAIALQAQTESSAQHH